VTIPNSDGNLSEEDVAQVTKLNAHMLATLRLTYDAGTDVVRRNDGYLNACQVNEEDFPTKIPFYGALPRNLDFRVDVLNIANTFNCASQMPELIALISETGLPALPLQYKFLAICKVFDLASKGEKGFSNTVRVIIDQRHQRFRDLGISSRQFRSFIHKFRNKCAHIYTGNEAALGIVGLTSEDADRVRKVLPLMRDTMVEVLQTCFGNLGMVFAAPTNLRDTS
jgi:hypothetical protein